jgi:UDP:flavonoid glycosyltransferase YjiC (YdhE family)
LTSRLRVFLGAFGQPGHAFPMLALGARLVERGHQVTFETWNRWQEHVEDAGMEFISAPEYRVFPTPEEPVKPYEAVRHACGLTRRALAARGPDVVVHDILTLAPALAGELEGLPVATLIPHVYPVGAPGFPPYAMGARLPRTGLGRTAWRSTQGMIEAGLRQGRRELNATRRHLGLPEVQRLHGGLSERLVIVGTFPHLEYPREWPGHVHVVGPLMWEPPAAEVDIPPGSEPLVLVAPSTAQDPAQELLRAALEGLAGGPVRVLATTNRRPLPVPVRIRAVGAARRQVVAVDAASRQVRARVAVDWRARAGAGWSLVNWVSYSRTIPQTSLVVCHAGHGTMVRALSCGVPVLAVPHSGDMGENAARLDWSGAGVRLPWRLLGPRTLRLAVQRALDPSPGYAARAAELASWAAEHDGPTRAAELIEDLAAR